VLKPDGSGQDSSLSSIIVTVKGAAKVVPVTNGSFLDTTAIDEGQNWIIVSTLLGKDSVLVNRIVNHTPFAEATAKLSGNSVTLDGSMSSDPDGQTLTNFKWLDDPVFPLGLNSARTVSVSVPEPPMPGEYYYGLIVTDPDGNADTTRSYFIVNNNGSIANPAIASNPEWAKREEYIFSSQKQCQAQVRSMRQRCGCRTSKTLDSISSG